MSEKGARGGHHTAHLPPRRVVRRAASSREVDALGFLAPMHVGQNWNGVTETATLRSDNWTVKLIFFEAFVPPTVSEIKPLMSAFACPHSLTS